MSEENVERVYRVYEALQKRDIDEFVGYFDPDIEWHSLVMEMEGTFYGHEGIRQWWANLLEAFPDWKLTIVEARDHGDWVVAHAGAQASGGGSGVGIDDDFWQVVRFRDERVVYYAALRTEAEALEAVGLRE